MIGIDANQYWINTGYVIAPMMKRVNKAVYIVTKPVLDNKFSDIAKRNNGVLILGIGIKMDGELAKGVLVSTLQDLDELIQTGLNVESLTRKGFPDIV